VPFINNEPNQSFYLTSLLFYPSHLSFPISLYPSSHFCFTNSLSPLFITLKYSYNILLLFHFNLSYSLLSFLNFQSYHYFLESSFLRLDFSLNCYLFSQSFNSLIISIYFSILLILVNLLFVLHIICIYLIITFSVHLIPFISVNIMQDLLSFHFNPFIIHIFFYLSLKFIFWTITTNISTPFHYYSNNLSSLIIIHHN
jgi:hypothetical protein